MTVIPTYLFLLSTSVSFILLARSSNGQPTPFVRALPGHEEDEVYWRGDPEDLTPEHPSQVFAHPHHLVVKSKPPGRPPKKLEAYKPSKGETRGEDLAGARPRPQQEELAVAGTRHGPQLEDLAAAGARHRPQHEDLAVAGTRHRPRQQSYNRQYNPQPRRYSHRDGHSNNKKTKGGYENSNSHQGSQGYASESSYDRANKGDYEDSDHQEYKHKDGSHRSGGGRGNVRYGNYGGEYGDDGNAYTSPGEDYKK